MEGVEASMVVVERVLLTIRPCFIGGSDYRVTAEIARVGLSGSCVWACTRRELAHLYRFDLSTLLLPASSV